MVKIKQVGIGQMASGTIDGITYVTRGDHRQDHAHVLHRCHGAP